MAPSASQALTVSCRGYKPALYSQGRFYFLTLNVKRNLFTTKVEHSLSFSSYSRNKSQDSNDTHSASALIKFSFCKYYASELSFYALNVLMFRSN